MNTASTSDTRRARLKARLDDTLAEVKAACDKAGRDVDEVTLVAVTKHFPASDVRALAELGVRDIGENRDQEAAAKAAEVADHGVDVRWHFVGRLQRNKCRSVAGYADMVQSLDRFSLVNALDKAALAERRSPLDVCMQLSVDGDPGRGGVLESDDESTAEAILHTEGLRLRGVMAVAPIDMEPERAFSVVARRFAAIRRVAPDATVMSAGMSGDFPAAIACGATMIRLGGKLLGPREYVG